MQNTRWIFWFTVTAIAASVCVAIIYGPLAAFVTNFAFMCLVVLLSCLKMLWKITR